MGNELLPLWEIWEEYHHIVPIITPPKNYSNNSFPPCRFRTSLFSVDDAEEYETDGPKFSMDRLSTLPSLEERATSARSRSNTASSDE
jgi:hypothetical protein